MICAIIDMNLDLQQKQRMLNLSVWWMCTASNQREAKFERSYQAIMKFFFYNTTAKFKN